MTVQEELIARMSAAQKRLERLESQEQRRLITDYDYLRGWKDDFLGKQIADQYDPVISGAGGAIGLWDAAHGGWVRLLTGAVAGNYARLWLGSAAFGQDSLDADYGWVMMVRIAVMSAATSVLCFMGAETTNRQIHVGLDTNASANWIIRTQDGFGTTNTDTGVGADANTHWHVAEVSPGNVKYYLDGALIGTATANVPTDVLTPDLLCLARSNAARAVYFDFAGWIPRNL